MSGVAAIRLVAEREVRERLRSRTYLVSSALVVALLVLGLVLPRLISAPTPTYRFAVVGPPPPGLVPALRQEAAPHDAHVAVRAYPTRAAALAAVRDGTVNALLDPRRATLVFRREVDRELVNHTQQALVWARLPARLAPYGLTPGGLQRLLAPRPVQVRSLEPNGGASKDTTSLVAAGGAALMLMAISLYGNWVLMGVAQEKTGRVVELLMVAIRPRDLLAGKVVGIGALGLLQVVIVAAVTAAFTTLGVTDLPDSFVPGAALEVPWFVLGFVLYAVGFGVAGALVTRQEDVSAAAGPVTGVLVVSFFVAYSALLAAPNGALAQLATVFPTTAPFVVPARSAMVGVPAWQHVLAVVTTVGSIYGLIRLGGRVYAAALLHTSPLAGLAAAWRLRSG